MTWLYFALAVSAWLFLVGVFGLVTSRNLIGLCLCLVVVQSSTYVLLAAIGYRRGAGAPVFQGTPPGAPAVDPVVQALMLTDVVVEAAVVALLLAVIVQIKKRTGTLDPDKVDLMKG